MALPQQEMLKNYRERLQALTRGADQGGGTAAGNQGTKDTAGEKIQVTPYVWGSGPAPLSNVKKRDSERVWISNLSKTGSAAPDQSAAPSETVSQARDYLQGVIGGGSGGYRSDYTGQIADLYDQIMNRPKFSYDPNQDPLYSAYRDQYMRNGQLAMRDAMGTAAGLTGGYGNSWGDTAGFQAYQAYLQQLGGVIPELEQRAYERYQGEGAEALQKLALAQEMEAADFSRYQSALAEWQNRQQPTGSEALTAAAAQSVADILDRQAGGAAASGTAAAGADKDTGSKAPTIQNTKPSAESILHNANFSNLTEAQRKQIIKEIEDSLK